VVNGLAEDLEGNAKSPRRKDAKTTHLRLKQRR